MHGELVIQQTKHLVRTLRLTRGWTRTTLARQAGLSYWTVGRAERGDGVSLDTAAKIALTLEQPFGKVWKPAVE